MISDYYFSPELKLFFPVALADIYKENGGLPDDVIKVDAKTFEKFSPGNKPEGKIIGCNKNGLPCWVNSPPPTKEDSRIWAEWNKKQLINQAESTITPLERAKRLGIATEAEKDSLLAWERYTVLLSRIDINQAPDISWPTQPTPIKQ
ncbi:tail fiber assembly protein [Serratia rubidaea]|nr:tail fiber assembly protein [Serratia rubidaea]